MFARFVCPCCFYLWDSFYFYVLDCVRVRVRVRVWGND